MQMQTSLSAVSSFKTISARPGANFFVENLRVSSALYANMEAMLLNQPFIATLYERRTEPILERYWIDGPVSFAGDFRGWRHRVVGKKSIFTKKSLTEVERQLATLSLTNISDDQDTKNTFLSMIARALPNRIEGRTVYCKQERPEPKRVAILSDAEMEARLDQNPPPTFIDSLFRGTIAK